MSFALSPDYRQANVIPQQSIVAASIGATYSLIGSVFGQGVVALLIVSTLDHTVQISLDGSIDFIPIPSLATLIIDLKSDQVALGGWRGVYVKQIGIPTTGSLYVGALGVS